MTRTVLIVEDNPLLAGAMACLVEEGLECGTVTVASVAEALPLLNDAGFNFGLLDVEVLDGDTYPLAAELQQRRIPFFFVSGSDPQNVPAALAMAPFFRKPVSPDEILLAARHYLK